MRPVPQLGTGSDNVQAYYPALLITAVKSFVVQTPKDKPRKRFCAKKYFLNLAIIKSSAFIFVSGSTA